MLGGYTGKLLQVDLTKNKIVEKSLSPEMIKAFIGGRGFGIKILFDEVKPRIDPLSPENKIIITTGPLAGTNAQSFARWIVTTKSPLTGTYFRSVGGGWFAPELKFAGYDLIVVEGKAEKPMYCWISDGKCEIKDASHLWGITTEETHRLIREETDPKARIVCIGPAGENLVRFACVVSDRRTAGRGGVGAVMGSKNLKAIAVRGTQKIGIADPDAFKNAVKKQIEIYKGSPFFDAFHGLGTNSVVTAFHELGHFPARNFKEWALEGVERFSPEELGKFVIKHYGCYGCIMACGKIHKVLKGPYSGIGWDHPEYETQWSFGAHCGNTNTESIIAANKLCDEYGLDTISTGYVIGFAMELYERGVISKYETGGLDLKWGNHEAMIEMVRRIALRDGLGNVLAEGAKRASEKIGRGAEKYAMHSKGLEMPAYEPRAAKAHGLSWATSPCGANHCIGWSKHEIVGIPRKVDPLTVENKGEICRYNQDETAVLETGIACIFPACFGLMTIELYAELLSSATGIKEFSDPKYLWLVGERIFNLERIFNVREGFVRKDDWLPERIQKEPVPGGPAKGQIFELKELLDQYYEARGWDKETGIPSRTKLDSLGLKSVSERLEEPRKFSK